MVMPTRERAQDRAARSARADLIRVGTDLRLARVNAGLSLAEVGRAAGISGSQVSRIERAIGGAIGVLQLARIGGAVGLRVRIQAYPDGDPLRDVAHIRLFERFRPRLHADLGIRSEVPLPRTGDPRAWDAWLSGLRTPDGRRIGRPVEGETRIVDAQAQLRRLALKLRDGGQDAVILLVADTKANRAAIRAAGDLIAELFPVPARRALVALAAGKDPGGSTLIFV